MASHRSRRRTWKEIPCLRMRAGFGTRPLRGSLPISQSQSLAPQTTGLTTTTSEQHQEDQDMESVSQTAVEDDHDEDMKEIMSIMDLDEPLPGSSKDEAVLLD